MKIKYVEQIKSGHILAGHYVKKAIERFENDLQRDDLIFDIGKAERVIDFFSRLQHAAGKFDGKSFILSSWQEFIIYNLYGFYYTATGRRRFRTVYLELARKQGKTAFAAGLCLYHLVADGEGAPEVLLAANSKDQANIAGRLAKGYARKADPKAQFLKIQRNEILFPAADGFLKILAADADRLDGYNCSFGFIDEFHSAPTPKVRDVLRSGQGMRPNPTLITCTTAGFDKSLPCYELRTTCTEIITGKKIDDTLFAMIWAIDEGDDWKNPEVWIKANPNIDVTVTTEWLQEQVTQAINTPSDEVGVLTKNLNIWCDSGETWIPDVYILSSTEKFDRQRFAGHELYIGVDLANNQDLTAVSYMFFNEGKFYFDVEYYIPRDSLKTRPDKELYKQWARENYITVTPGNVTDYNYITEKMVSAHADFYIVVIEYDSYNATQWAILCTAEGLPLEQYSQTIGNFNKPTRGFERELLAGNVVFNDNPITRYCMRNVELRRDHNGNVKPDKLQDKKKIDGVIAMLQSFAGYLEHHRSYNLKIY